MDKIPFPWYSDILFWKILLFLSVNRSCFFKVTGTSHWPAANLQVDKAFASVCIHNQRLREGFLWLYYAAVHAIPDVSTWGQNAVSQKCNCRRSYSFVFLLLSQPEKNRTGDVESMFADVGNQRQTSVVVFVCTLQRLMSQLAAEYKDRNGRRALWQFTCDSDQH